jgi:chromosome segregation ATPase
MNWIEENKKQAVFIANIEHWHPGDVYQVIETSIVREEVERYEKKLAAAKAELERLKAVNEEWKTLWQPIDDFARPLTKLGHSVSATALQLLQEVELVRAARDNHFKKIAELNFQLKLIRDTHGKSKNRNRKVMTDAEFYKKFMQVLDKGIELYTKALNTERGDEKWWLLRNNMHYGLCCFFELQELPEIKEWVKEVIGEDVYIAEKGWITYKPRHERFAKRLAILKQIKKELGWRKR